MLNIQTLPPQALFVQFDFGPSEVRVSLAFELRTGSQAGQYWAKIPLVVDLAPAGPESLGPYNPARAVAAFQGGGEVQVANSHINVAGRDNHTHTHVHYHGAAKDLKGVLDAISNLRKIQQDTLDKATPGTVLWLFTCKEYRIFIDVDGVLKILWGSGIPGAGKTVLASIVIDRLEALAREWGNEICVAYVYIRYSDQNQVTVRGILEVLVKQTEGTQPMEGELLQLLGQFVAKRKATFYVLDALDEAPVRIRLALIQKLSSLGVRLFITSRPLPALEAKFPAAHTFPILAQEHDLDLHIAEKIEGSEDLQDLLDRGGPEFEEHLIKTVKAKCGGMFLHASLQLDALQQCITVHDALQVLDAFPDPRRIEDVYQQTWERIIQSERHASLAQAAFVWVLNAKQSMTIDQLLHALATSPETHRFESLRLMPEAALMTICRGLITVDKESRLVRLVHYTAKGPLEDLLRESFPRPHSLLTAVCITRLKGLWLSKHIHHFRSGAEDGLGCRPPPGLCLSGLGFPRSRITQGTEDDVMFSETSLVAKDFRTTFPETRKALCATAGNGDHHPTRAFPAVAKALSPNTEMLQEMSWARGISWTFPSSRSPRLSTVSSDLDGRASTFIGGCRAFPVILFYHSLSLPIDFLGPLHLVSFYNLPIAFVGSVDAHDTNLRTRNWSATPLHLACHLGNEAAAQALLCMADILVNAKDSNGQTVLLTACRRGYNGIVKLLLAHPNTDVNLADSHNWTALMHASRNGHEVTAATRFGLNALLLACEYGRTSVVELLLAVPGIDANGVDSYNDTAIKMAAERGHEEIVRLLLRVPGINPALRSHSGNTAMSVAVARGHHSIVRLLQNF
ncbi:hypothetical protein BKA70DRAFT_1559519 [Coprinopsis sp. MPI-PUGE-AT-0042]|nr:hypothetical protein BKA70DRAFT_1559519 [Coprinopsis sp. MPI-PUGE-AT-0042]